MGNFGFLAVYIKWSVWAAMECVSTIAIEIDTIQ